MKKVFRSAALLLLCTTVYAQDITQTMSMNLQNVTLKEFFKNLEAQTSFSVVYRDVILSEDADVVVSASNRQLKDILSQVLEKYGLSYKVSNKTIVIVKAEAQAKAYRALENELTETELAVAHRARNSHPYNKAKNASGADYMHATALEAVIGYLYVSGQSERLEYIQKTAMEKTDE